MNWWRVNAEGNWDLITGEMWLPPPDLLPTNIPSLLVGISDGDLWRIHLDNKKAENLTAEFQAKIHSLVWPNRQIDRAKMRDRPESEVNQFVIRAKTDKEEDSFYTIRLSQNNLDVVPIQKPSSGAAFRDFSPQKGSTLFAAKDATGTFLWTIDTANQSSEKSTPFLETNTWLQEIHQGQLKKIEYQSLQGETLIAWIILPPDYKEGNRYPLIADVYAGKKYNPKDPPRSAHINYASTSNRQLLAAKGFVVLFPSMPMEKPLGLQTEMLDGLIPAVDKVIDLGIADKNRLGLIGHSRGGFSVCSIISQTNRFKAAIALSGRTDNISLYGTFGPETEYLHPLLKVSFAMGTFESNFGGPPWEHLSQYLSESPIAYVHQVETPLMIVHGDRDGTNIQQSEEFFTALYRQGKPARFLRYRGEGHLITGHANTLDMWDRIYDWFDTYLKDKK